MSGKSLAAKEWRENWTLVLAAAAGVSLFSIMVNIIGTFMEPLAKDFGWTRTVLSLGPPIAGVVCMIFSPFVGVIIDRHGSRKVALPGVILVASSIAAFSLASGSVLQWVGLWTINAFVSLLVAMNVWSTAVAVAFTAGRGLALGVMMTGAGVAQAAAPIIATKLVDGFGWRPAFVVIACIWGGVALLLCVLFFDQRGSRRSTSREEADNSGLTGLSIRQAWRDPGLWRVAISTFLLLALTIGLLIHQIPILTEIGVSRENAAWLVGLAGIAGIAGKLATGVLLDLYRANWVGGLILSATGLAFALLLEEIRTPFLIVVAIIIHGFSAGTKLQMCSYLTSRYAGLRNFGTIFGAVSSLLALGASLGPLIAGVLYDMAGSYTLFVLAGAVGCQFCAYLILTLPPYPDWSNEKIPENTVDLFSRPKEA